MTCPNCGTALVLDEKAEWRHPVVLEDCRCEWRKTVSFWPLRFRRRWHRCTLLAGHAGPCECKCGRRLAPLLAATIIQEGRPR